MGVNLNEDPTLQFLSILLRSSFLAFSCAPVVLSRQRVRSVAVDLLRSSSSLASKESARLHSYVPISSHPKSPLGCTEVDLLRSSSSSHPKSPLGCTPTLQFLRVQRVRSVAVDLVLHHATGPTPTDMMMSDSKGMVAEENSPTLQFLRVQRVRSVAVDLVGDGVRL